MLQGTCRLWQKEALRGEAVLGLEYINHTKAADEIRTEKALYYVVGYRQYLWRGLHVQLTDFLTTKLKVTSDLDGREYSGSANVGEAFVGYKFAFAHGQSRFYVLPQVGVAKELNVATPWPGRDPKVELIPNILVGISF